MMSSTTLDSRCRIVSRSNVVVSIRKNSITHNRGSLSRKKTADDWLSPAALCPKLAKTALILLDFYGDPEIYIDTTPHCDVETRHFLAKRWGYLMSNSSL